MIDCTGKTIVAGFWNSHVHFTEPVWRNAATAPAAPLTAHMQAMLTKWGFTTVWDLGADPANSLPLRRRINSGEVLGPNIFLAGSIFPKDGRPAYLPPDMQLPEAATPEASGANGAGTICGLGLDGIKLFTGVFKGEDNPVVNMDAAIAKAAVDVAHAQGKPVFAHPQNKAGIEAVIAAGVDVMAHTVAGQPGYPRRTARALQAAEHCADADIVAVCKAAGAARDRHAHSSTTSSASSRLFGQWQHRPVRHRRRLHPVLRHHAGIRADAPRACRSGRCWRR